MVIELSLAVPCFVQYSHTLQTCIPLLFVLKSDLHFGHVVNFNTSTFNPIFNLHNFEPLYYQTHVNTCSRNPIATKVGQIPASISSCADPSLNISSAFDYIVYWNNGFCIILVH